MPREERQGENDAPLGGRNDLAKLERIRQIPSVVGARYPVSTARGEVCPLGEIRALKKRVEDSGLSLEVIRTPFTSFRCA